MAVLLVCAAIMVGGVFYTSCMSSQSANNAAAAGNAKVAIRVAGTPVYADFLSNAIAQQRGQFASAGSTPEMEFFATASTISQLVDSAARAALVQKSGAPMDDASLVKVFNQTIDDQLEAVRDNLIQSKKLKPDATQKEFEDVVKSQSGRTLEEIRNEQVKQFQAALADPNSRSGALMAVAPKILQEQAAAKLNLTEADIKQSFDRLEVKRIQIKDVVPGKTSVDERLAKAQAALKSGITFEQAIDRYSEELPFGGKKLSDSTTTITGTSILSDPEMKPLRGLKVGDVSEPVKLPDGKAIYKVVSIKSDLPKDYEARKAFYRQNVVDQITRKDLDDQLTAYKATPGAVTFESAGYKAAYDFQQAQQGPSGTSGGDQNAKMRAVYDEATKAAKAGGYDERAAVLARYMAISQLWGAPGADKNKLRPEMIDTLKAFLDRSESFEVRLRLVDLYREAKQYPEAVEQLAAAASNNKTDEKGKTNDAQITAKLTQMTNAKEITPEQQKTVVDAQAQWRTLMQEAERQQEEVRKAQADAVKAQMEAEAKAKAQKGPAAGAGGKPGSAPAPTTGSTAGTAPGTNIPVNPGPVKPNTPGTTAGTAGGAGRP